MNFIKTKETLKSKKFFLLGIPVFKIKYTPKKTTYFLFSFIKFFSFSRSLRFSLSCPFNTKNFKPIHYDDTLLIKTLKKMEPFTYIPNPGNLGDVLIAASTLLFFEKNHLKYQFFNGSYAGNLVVGGGGHIPAFISDTGRNY